MVCVGSGQVGSRFFCAMGRVGSGPINWVRLDDSRSMLSQQNLGSLTFSQFGSTGPGFAMCLLLDVDRDVVFSHFGCRCLS